MSKRVTFLAGTLVGIVCAVSLPVFAKSWTTTDVYNKLKKVTETVDSISDKLTKANDNILTTNDNLLQIDSELAADHEAIYDLLLYIDYNAYVACFYTKPDATLCMDSGKATGDTLPAMVNAFRVEHGLVTPTIDSTLDQ